MKYETLKSEGHIESDRVVVTVPTDATVNASKARLNACFIAGIQNAQLIDESTATAYAYEQSNLIYSTWEKPNNIVA